MRELLVLPDGESELRIARFCSLMSQCGIGLAVISDNAGKYYLTGRVFSGWIVLSAGGASRFFVKRPVDIAADGVSLVRKPEDIPDLLDREILESPGKVGFEMGTLSVNDFERLSRIFPGRCYADISGIMRQARSVKTPAEIDLISESGLRQERVYRLVPELYRPGMTDIELQIEIERALRLEGCLGLFRISGSSMELFMGNILAGDNADNPATYDFAMGGAGADPSLPVGADGTVIRPGMSVMVDANGNFTGYMSDMTRTFSLGQLPDEALRAHRCSIDICNELARIAVPGENASRLYQVAVDIVNREGLEDFFMGHRQKAGFVGHGVGIEINEAPVIAPRSRDVIAQGNVIALEPKFVIPGVGAVGIENTYVVGQCGLRCVTNAPVGILPLD